jgi:uncharacterized MnhB-related membrane protein
MEINWEIVVTTILIAAAVLGAFLAMVAKRILAAALWLASVSAVVATILYRLGAQQVAVIELSVGAGLVTVLLVYAISVVGDDALDPKSIIPRPLALVLVLIVAGLLAWLGLPLVERPALVTETTLASTLWEHRVLDVWVQIVLIFSGVLGMLGLLAEGKSKPRSGLQSLTEVLGRKPTPAEIIEAGAAVRDSSVRPSETDQTTENPL